MTQMMDEDKKPESQKPDVQALLDQLKALKLIVDEQKAAVIAEEQAQQAKKQSRKSTRSNHDGEFDRGPKWHKRAHYHSHQPNPDFVSDWGKHDDGPTVKLDDQDRFVYCAVCHKPHKLSESIFVNMGIHTGGEFVCRDYAHNHGLTEYIVK